MDELLKQFKEAQQLPSKLSELHYKLAAHYGEVALEFESKIPAMAAEKKRLMANSKSITAGEKEFEIGLLGIYEKQAKIRLKSLEKLLSAVKRRIETLDKEVANQY